MELFNKIVVSGQIVGGLTPIYVAYWAMWKTIYAGDDIASFVKKSNAANIKDKMKSFYKIASTVDVRDLFGWHRLNSYMKDYKELDKYLRKGINS
jgi:hypothetical protein